MFHVSFVPVARSTVPTTFSVALYFFHKTLLIIMAFHFLGRCDGIHVVTQRAIARFEDYFAALYKLSCFGSEKRIQLYGLVVNDPYFERCLIEKELELIS
jgi:hypothetical protein